MYSGGNSFYQKNPRVREIFCPQFWGRKWLHQFYGCLEKYVLSAGKTHAHKIRVLGVGYSGSLGGGGEVPILFYGREDFSDSRKMFVCLS